MKKVIFVADVFVDEYAGGAELTTQALIESCSFEYTKVKAKDLDMEFLKDNYLNYFVFGNFGQIDPSIIPTIVANCRYAVLEYDYKFCKYRSIERHMQETGNPCDCHEQTIGKLVSAFYYGADQIFWMSQNQKNIFQQRFPFLDNKGIILSSVFSKKAIQQFKFLGQNTSKEGWLIQDSESWIKGTDRTIKWAEDNNKQYETFKGLTHNQLLMKFYNAKGFVFLPKGGDTCPRVVIEAKLLGCELHLNSNVQHAQEEWFADGTVESILQYLENRPFVFWEAVKRTMDLTSTLSGYTTTYNCISQEYPYEKSILSLVDLCDEIIVVDAGSTDGTFERLLDLEKTYSKLKVKQVKVDFDHPRWAIESDGHLKAKARALCTSDWCWQMDSDEVVHRGIRPAVQELMQLAPKNYDILALPIIEYWGDEGKVRADVNPWKWRLSRNKPHITHGVPKELRALDEDGNLYAQQGTDSCDYIHTETFEQLLHSTFYDENIHKIRLSALQGNEEHLEIYEHWINQVITTIPTIFHYSWYDIERKIRSYKTHWGKFWKSMYNLDEEDTPENNVCFDKPWNEVLEEDIKNLAQRLKIEKGGHIFHSKVDWNIKVPHIRVNIEEPNYEIIK